MHKGMILLTKAQNEDDARNNVENFLEQYGDGNVWDWYVIGGRWSGTLNAAHNQFKELAMAHLAQAYPDTDLSRFITENMISEQADALNSIWQETLGQPTPNPFVRSSYLEDGFDDDILPLSECVGVVLKWNKDMGAFAEEMFEKMLQEREKEKEGKSYPMSGYYARLYSDAKSDNFCFDTNVYDTVNYTNNPSRALEEAEGWFAVMVDLHN